MRAGAACRIAARALASSLVADEKGVDRAALEGLVELERPIDQRLHHRELREQLRVVFTETDERAPGGGRPVEERRVGSTELRHGAPRILLELARNVGPLERHGAQAVIARAAIKA